jgi:hypothetical protein
MGRPNDPSLPPGCSHEDVDAAMGDESSADLEARILDALMEAKEKADEESGKQWTFDGYLQQERVPYPVEMSTRYEQLKKEVEAFNETHPEVWEMFERFAFEATRFRAHFGVGAVWERMRWETGVNPGAFAGGDFKLNNNYRAFYARAFEKKYPRHAGFFRKRKQTSREDSPRE